MNSPTPRHLSPFRISRLLLLGFICLWGGITHNAISESSTPLPYQTIVVNLPLELPTCAKTVQAQQHNRSNHQTLLTLSIPQKALNNCLQLEPAAWKTLKTLHQIKQTYHPLAAINGGFFDPNNQQTVSFITLPHQHTFDPRDNKHLTNSAGLKPYLKAIWNRSEFRTYTCDTPPTLRYDITPHSAAIPKACHLLSNIGAGPQLLPTLTAKSEAFYTIDTHTKRVIRNPVRIHHALARSAVAITPDGTIILAMGLNTPNHTGWTLAEMSHALKTMGAHKALSLDGGSSSGLLLNKTVTYGTHNKDNQPQIRRLKSVLWLVYPEPPTQTDIRPEKHKG